MYFIYTITNLVNNKKYVGQTNNIERRWKRHIKDAQAQSNLSIHRAIRKYGIHLFIFEIIAISKENSNIDYLETEIIKQYNSFNPEYGYNLTSGGGKNRIISEETRKKMSEAQKGPKSHMYGKTVSLEVRQKISKTLSGENHPAYGKKHTEEFKNVLEIFCLTSKKMSEAQKGPKSHMYGKTVSLEVRQKISKTLSGENHPAYGKKHTEEFKNYLRIINTGKVMSPESIEKTSASKRKLNLEQANQIREDYKIIKSSRELAKKYKLSKTTILRVLNNKIYQNIT